MRKMKSFWISLILAFVLALSVTPALKLISIVSRILVNETDLFPSTVNLSSIISNPFPLINTMLVLLTANAFFFMDIENGFIKNIAGQVPEKGYTVLSKFVAIIPYNLLFMLAGLAGSMIGTLPFQKIVLDARVQSSVAVFCVKFLLLQSICAILLLVTAGFRSKTLGTVLAVLMGTGGMSLAYVGVDIALGKLLPGKNFMISEFMPDQLLKSSFPKPMVSILVSAVTGVFFLLLAIHVFGKRDVK